MQLKKGDALIVVDVQRDFLPGGSLAVPRGDEVIPVLNRYLERFVAAELMVVATRDWHPPNHCSFVSRGGTWPPHCVKLSVGAEFPDELALPDSALIVSKATSAAADAYSGFDGTLLEDALKQAGIRRIFVGGLATDYCVLATVTDGIAAGFEVVVLEDAIRAVAVQPGDEKRALASMREAGATLTTLVAPDVAV